MALGSKILDINFQASNSQREAQNVTQDLGQTKLHVPNWVFDPRKLNSTETDGLDGLVLTLDHSTGHLGDHDELFQ